MIAVSSAIGAERLSLRGHPSVWIVAADADGPVRVLRSDPVLHRAGHDSVRATVVLDRQPQPDESRIGHLISDVTLSLDVELAPDASVLRAVAAQLGRPALPAAVRAGSIALVTGDGRVLLAAKPDVTGRALLAGTVGGRDAHDLAIALTGVGEVLVRFNVHVLADPTTRRITIRGRWVDLWDRLRDVGLSVGRARFESAVAQLLEAGCISVIADPGSMGEDATKPIADMLWGRRVVIGATSGPDSLELGPRPEGGAYSATEVVVVGDVATLEGRVSLRTLLEASTRPIEQLMILTVADDKGGGLVPAAPRRRARESRATVVTPIAIGAAVLASAENVVGVPIHAPLAPPALGVRPSFDFVVGETTPPGPVVADPSDNEWPDHENPALCWYAPVPSLTEQATDEPTLFKLHHEGLTADGQLALRAQISIPFDLHDPAPADAGERRAVDVEPLTVDLDLPFRDADADNELRRHKIRGEIQVRGQQKIAEFQVLNAWARIAYRALSDDTAEPARLVVSYRFSGYERISVSDPPTKTYGATLLRPNVISGLMINPSNLSIAHPFGRFQIDADKARRARPPKILAGQFQKVSGSASRLARKSFSRSEQLDVQRNCAEHPSAYIEQQGEAEGVIGCRSAFQLGTVAYRQFREVTSMRTDRYRVYQSQTDAGRYLIVPAKYRLSHSPDDGSDRAYRPLIVLHAAVGVDADDVEVVFEAGLQPDLRPIDRLELETALLALDERAKLVWPTEVPGANPTFSWTVADTLARRLTSTALPSGTIHFSASLDVTAWMVLRGVLATSTVNGWVRFDFADGSSVDSTIEIDLRRIVGPWDSGPLVITLAEGAVTLANPTSSTISVAFVSAYLKDGTVESTPVDQLISAGSSVTIPWSPPAGARLVTDHDIVVGDPVTVEEIRSFMEEVEVTVVILNQIEVAVAVTVEGRISGREPLKRVELRSSEPAKEISFPLPLSVALESPTFTYRVVREGTPGPWRTHDLSSSAFVIVTHEDII